MEYINKFESKNIKDVVKVKENLSAEIDCVHESSYWTAKALISDAISAIETQYHKKETYNGISTGFTELDNITSGFQNSELIIIGSRPSVGKTSLVLAII